MEKAVDKEAPARSAEALPAERLAVRDFLSQTLLFGERVPALTQDLARVMYEYRFSGKKNGEFFNSWPTG